MTFIPLSYQDESGDGSTKTFPIHITFAKESLITVTVDNVSVPFTFGAGPSITLTDAVAPTTGQVIRISRTEEKDTLRTTFSDGSTLTATDLNALGEQLLAVSQEAFDEVEGFQGQLDNITLVSGNLPSVTASNASHVLHVDPSSGLWQTSTRLTDAETSIATNASTITTNASTAVTNLADHVATLGTSAAHDAGTSAGDVLLINTNNKLPVLDGSALTNVRHMAVLTEEVASGVHGGETRRIGETFTSGPNNGTVSTGWHTRQISTVSSAVGTHGVTTTTGGKFRLENGKTYRVRARSCTYDCWRFRTCIKNETTGQIIKNGDSFYSNSHTNNHFSEVTTIVAGYNHEFSIQTWTDTTIGIYGLGRSSDLPSENEIYTTVEIEVV